MKILIYSSVFLPQIGGVEVIMSTLAHEFVGQGHDVKLVTHTPSNEVDTFPFEVIRLPTITQFLNLTSWCDLCIHACVSLKVLWPLLIVKKPLVLIHHTWYRYPGSKLTWQVALKHWVTRFAAANIAPSQAIADQLPAFTTVIPNSYQDDVFYEMPEIPRVRDLVFLGRLVSDKGADLLLNSLGLLKQKGLEPNLTIIGQGPEEAQLKQQTQTLGIAEQVQFVGIQRGESLARLLNAHKILVVPSKWQEPFGIVTLEGIACGCVVVGSKDGGLKDAIGLCGVTFPNENLEELTKALVDLLTNHDKLEMYKKYREAHLIKHRKDSVAKAYLQIMEAIVQ